MPPSFNKKVKFSSGGRKPINFIHSFNEAYATIMTKMLLNM